MKPNRREVLITVLFLLLTLMAGLSIQQLLQYRADRQADYRAELLLTDRLEEVETYAWNEQAYRSTGFTLFPIPP